MTEETPTTEQPITTGEWVRGLLIVIVAAAVMVGLAVWLVVPNILTCGCTRPT